MENYTIGSYNPILLRALAAPQNFRILSFRLPSQYTLIGDDIN